MLRRIGKTHSACAGKKAGRLISNFCVGVLGNGRGGVPECMPDIDTAEIKCAVFIGDSGKGVIKGSMKG